jgi:hypothetical protein
MDWEGIRGERARPKEPAPLQLLEICWRVQGHGGGRVFSCGIYRDVGPGLEVRVWVTSEDDLLRSQRTAEIGSAREVAEEWRRTVVAKGFVEV